ncbi:immunity protein YezG family protein [Aliivibrio wodanis]|uniref:immunity protein YezG family protein n=1 Tax=Aliivibrio wodanis TaxID=80852 RepID=UPI00406D1C99
MFENEINIYHHIGQSMFNALPEEWDSAYFYFRMLGENGDCTYKQWYLIDNKVNAFSVNEIDDEYEDAKCADAFFSLYKLMKKDESNIPWNKARFELKPDGSFDMKFKYDEDFAWFQDLDLGKKQESDLFDALLDSGVDDIINSWEGLPEDFDRYWLK